MIFACPESQPSVYSDGPSPAKPADAAVESMLGEVVESVVERREMSKIVESQCATVGSRRYQYGKDRKDLFIQIQLSFQHIDGL